MIAVVTLCAVTGVYLLYSAIVHGQRSLPELDRSRKTMRAGQSSTMQQWLRQAGMLGVSVPEFVAVELIVCGAVSFLAWMLFAGPVPAVVSGVLVAIAPVTVYRNRRMKLREQARNAWPLLIEEIRLQTGSLGRSIPVALFEVGRRAPTTPMVEAFDAAHREWLLSTDFHRSIRVLKTNLADPTADAVCETLVVAHELGGNDLERRLTSLIEDRRTDLRNRNEASSRQAGVRFARWFVLVVPLGMTLVGLSIGDGRRAYNTPFGQFAVVIALLMMAGCWVWASAIMRLPEVDRVFDQ